jgi:hypothetical protein
MNDPVQLLIDAGAIPASPFDETSRYHGVPLALHPDESGEPARAYVTRRFPPAPVEGEAAARHTVSSLDRPDVLSARYLGDPLLYWKIADANAVVDPHELTDTVGRRIVVTVTGS